MERKRVDVYHHYGKKKPPPGIISTLIALAMFLMLAKCVGGG